MTKPSHIECHIGDDTPVRVWFDYSPGQPEQSAGPSNIHQQKVDPHITIYRVIVAGIAVDKDEDILPDLSPECIDRLEQQCLDKVR